MTMTTLEDLLVEQVRDLYDAEKQLVRALPKMAQAATSDDLQRAPPESFGGNQESGFAPGARI